jgi:tetratricopeptide (TPR) repeat protein
MALDDGRTLLAIAELRGLGSEDIDNPEYDYYLGLALMARAEKNTAEQAFKEALKKKPSYKEALLKLVELYFAKGFFADAETMVNEFLALSPDDPDILAVKADIANRMASVSAGG